MGTLCSFCIRCLLERHEKVLSRSIDVDQTLLTVLTTHSVITPNEMQEVKLRKTPQSKVVKLLYYVKKKMRDNNKDIYERFVTNLNHDGRHQHVINLLSGNVHITCKPSLLQ